MVQLPAEQTLLVGFAPDKVAFVALSFCTFAVVISMCAMAARFIFQSWLQHRSVQKGVREKAEKLSVTHGAELESMFGLHCNRQSQQPLSPGILMRIQGRVVSESQASLVAPLSGQSCTLYSASVSHQRHDGIHQPVAFRSESTDFVVELSGSPHLRIAVDSHDVALFDMVCGKEFRECALAEAPDSWRAFLLAHCVPGQDVSSGMALGRNDSLLDFREAALLEGAEVTCIGEVVRDRNGKLSLHPWQPSDTKVAMSTIEFTREDHGGRNPFRPLQELVSRLLSPSRKISPSPPAPRRESLMGRVMVSDDPELLG